MMFRQLFEPVSSATPACRAANRPAGHGMAVRPVLPRAA